MNRRIPGDPVAMWTQDLVSVVGQRRVFEPGLGEALGDPAVKRNVRRSQVRIRVEGLVIDDNDGFGRGQGANELVSPLTGRVQLEARLWVQREATIQRVGPCRSAEALR